MNTAGVAERSRARSGGACRGGRELISPMLATLGEVPAGPGWAFEVSSDGRGRHPTTSSPFGPLDATLPAVASSGRHAALMGALPPVHGRGVDYSAADATVAG